MNGGVQSASSCCSRTLPIGGVSPPDFAALDALAIKLISLGPAFAAPLRGVGSVLGGRIAAEHQRRRFGDALDALSPSCGLEGVLRAEFLTRTDTTATLKLQGCTGALGWPLPVVQRAVCSYDEGLFEGFLRGLTGDAELTVEEVGCLGLGQAECQFAIAGSSSASHQAVDDGYR